MTYKERVVLLWLTPVMLLEAIAVPLILTEEYVHRTVKPRSYERREAVEKRLKAIGWEVHQVRTTDDGSKACELEVEYRRGYGILTYHANYTNHNRAKEAPVWTVPFQCPSCPSGWYLSILKGH